MIKIFGIGNILLCDDGIGVKIAEKIKEQQVFNLNEVKVFIGETNIMYCLDEIENGDFLIIIDSSYFMLKPGEVSIKSLEQCREVLGDIREDHGGNLIKNLFIYRKNIRGYLIGIEVSKVEFSLELSCELREHFNEIYEKVIGYIEDILKSINGDILCMKYQ